MRTAASTLALSRGRLGRAGSTAVSVMGGHLAIGAVDLRVIEAGLDHRDLGVVGNQQPGGAAEEGEGLDVGVDPVAAGSRSSSAQANDRLDPPITATKTCARRISPVSGGRRSPARCRRRSRRTACRRPDGSGASSPADALPSPDTARRSGCSGSRPDWPRYTRPTGSAA